MSSKVTHYYYPGRDNNLKVIVKQLNPATGAYSVVDLSGVTRVILILGTKTIDSQSEGTFYTKDANGNLGMDLSDVTGIAVGTYDGESDLAAHKLRLTIYDDVNTAGLEIGRTYRIVVREA